MNDETRPHEFISFSDGIEGVFRLCDGSTYPAGMGPGSGYSSRRGNFTTLEYRRVAGGVGS